MAIESGARKSELGPPELESSYRGQSVPSCELFARRVLIYGVDRELPAQPTSLRPARGWRLNDLRP